MVDYLDGQSKGKQIRVRIRNKDEFAPGEDKAPVNAPDWTKSGYNGALKKYVDAYFPDEAVEEGENREEEEDDNDDEEEKNEDEGDDKESGEDKEDGTRSLVSEEYDSEESGNIDIE